MTVTSTADQEDSTMTDRPMRPSDRLVMLKALEAGLRGVIRDAEADVLALADESGATGFKTDHGRVNVQQRDGTRRIEDERALLAWVREHAPTEVTEVVRPAYKKTALDALVDSPYGLAHPETGELVEWAGYGEPSKPFVAWPASDAQKALKAHAETLFAERAQMLSEALRQIEAGEQE